MKAIDKFGGWILDTRAGLIFGIIVILAGSGVFIAKASKTVTLSSSEFVCVQAEPWGITTRCTVYSRVR
jgi:hypothetical protein